MSIIGVFTDLAIVKARQALNNDGFQIYPTSFGVSRVADALDPLRTAANAGLWYQGIISSRVVVSDTTIKFVCTIPPGVIPPLTTDTIREIYLFGQDGLFVDFLMSIGHPSTPIVYDPSGSITLELELALSNVDLSSLFVFTYTQAQELGEHNTDPNAHPELVDAVNRAGIYLKTGGVPFAYSGQSFDEKAEFSGTVAQNIYSGITVSAVHTGTFNNGAVITFNGVKTIAQVTVEYNNLNPGNEITHSGPGTVIPPAGVTVLSGGTILVSDGDIVYRDVDGFYKKALADGSIKSRVSGIAKIVQSATPKRLVRSNGFNAKTTGYTIGTLIYLSDVVAGTITDSITAIQLGHVVGTNYILIGTGGGGSGGGSGGTEFDAVITDTPGLSHYITTQAAINAVPSGSHILMEKLEILGSMVTTGGKRLKITVASPTFGWIRFTGNAEEQKITFAAVPTSGTWRIEWNGNQTTDLAFNANAAAVQSAINLLTGPGLPVTVTGNYTIGFSVVWTSFVNVPEMTFTDPGTDEVQKVQFTDIPDDGTFRLNYNGQDTVNIAFNDDAAYIENALENLPNLTDVDVTGNFTIGFTITFKNQDGKQPQPQITIVNNTLTKLLAVVTPSVSTLTQGIYSQQNLKNGLISDPISIATLIGGNPIGPVTAIQITQDDTFIVGYGKFENFTNGVDLNGHTGVVIDANFKNVTNPVIGNSALSPGVDYKLDDSIGVAKQVIRTVGLSADYPTLDAAYTSANTGDKIQVFEDQTISVAKTWNKNIEIEFFNDSRILVDTLIAGSVITFGNQIRTKNMQLVLTVAGTYLNAYLFQGLTQHHLNLGLETSGASVIVTNGFHIDSGTHIHFIEGWIKINSSTVTTVLKNDSGFVSHNAVIRDKDNGITHTLLNAQPPVQEVPTGTVNGINNTFVLSGFPANADAVLVMVDGVPRTKTTHWTLAGLNIIFTPGNLPQPSQDVYVYYWTTALQATPPSGRATPLDTYENNVVKSTRTHKINFRNGMDVTLDAAGEVTVDVSPGGGLGTWTNEVHTLTGPEITAKQFNMSNTPITPTDILVDIVGGPSAQVYGTDFTITGLVFNFNGLGLDGLLAAGDKLRLAYFR